MKTHKLAITFALVLGVLAAWGIQKYVQAGDDLDKSIKVTICHIPPGNPENRHTITVSLKALDHHLAHGDYIGECVEDPPEEVPPPDVDA